MLSNPRKGSQGRTAERGAQGRGVRTLLLVRTGASHDARVLRAARVAERTVGGGTLIVGVATADAPAGETTVEGVRVLRLSIGRRGPVSGSVALAAPAAPAAPSPGASAGRLAWRTRSKRVLSGASFAWQALAVARRERPALVQANDWNTMWCALAIKLTCGARVVYDTHELWPDRNGRWEWRWWLLASEALFVRAADAVIAASPGYADALAERYRVERPTTIRNIPENVAPVAAGGSPLQASGNGHADRSSNGHTDPSGNSYPPAPREGPLVVYVGGLMPGRGLEQTIDALALAPEVRLRAVGPGAQSYRASLIERAAAAGVGERLELEPPVPPAAVASVLREATAGLCLFQPMCRSYELGLPNKLFEYAAAGVPMLASDLPVMGTIVREERLGEVVHPSDPAGIAAGLRRLCEPGRWNSSETARHVRAFAQANDWDSEARVLAGVYTGVLTRRARGTG